MRIVSAPAAARPTLTSSTQTIEQDIIRHAQEMIDFCAQEATKRYQEQPEQTGQSQQQDSKLIELLPSSR